MKLTTAPYLPPSIFPIEIEIRNEIHTVAHIDIYGDFSRELFAEGLLWREIFKASLPVACLMINLERKKKGLIQNLPLTKYPKEVKQIDSILRWLLVSSNASLEENNTFLETHGFVKDSCSAILKSRQKIMQKNQCLILENFSQATRILYDFIIQRHLTIENFFKLQ